MSDMSIYFMWAVNIFNTFSHTSIQFTIVLMNWHNFTSYFIVSTYVNFRLVLSTLAYIFRCRLFPLSLKHHKRVLYLYFVVLGTQLPWSFYTDIWNILLVTNFQYGHCAYVYFNAVNFLYGVVLYKCTLCHLITWAKTFVCLSFSF